VQQKEKAASFLLRMSLGFFLLLWSCDKFAEPDSAVRIFQGFYNVPISTASAYFIGAIEALLSILIIAGAWRSYAYAIGLVLHAISTIASWRQLTSPFNQDHHLFVAAIPVLTAFIALYLLRDRDALWAFDGLPAFRHSSGPRTTRARQLRKERH
jgi:putative oxidoreductase